MKLPAHTLNYFAKQCYHSWILRGINSAHRSKTIQGASILCTVHPSLKSDKFPNGFVQIYDETNFEEYQIKIQKGWKEL